MDDDVKRPRVPILWQQCHRCGNVLPSGRLQYRNQQTGRGKLICDPCRGDLDRMGVKP